MGTPQQGIGVQKVCRNLGVGRHGGLWIVWGCGWTYSGQRGLGGHGGTLGRESEGENGKLRQE